MLVFDVDKTQVLLGVFGRVQWQWNKYVMVLLDALNKCKMGTWQCWALREEAPGLAEEVGICVQWKDER